MTFGRSVQLTLSLVMVALAPLSAAPALHSPSASTPACSSTPQGGATPLATASRTFGLEVARRLSASPASPNLFMSPISAELALAMTAQGARGGTQDAMLRAIGLSAGDATGMPDAARRLRSQLDAGSCGALRIADAVWAKKGMDVRPEYRSAIEQGFGGRVTSLDMASPTAPSTINRWVSQQTAGMIPKLVDELPANTVLYLANATSFQGKWKTEFDPGQTRTQPFQRITGGPAQVPLMIRSGSFSYGQGDGFQAVALPYAGGSLRMVVVLPSATLPIGGFAPYLDKGRFDSVLASLRNDVEGTLQLPRFKTDGSLDLMPPLRQAGMTPAFTGTADFSGISPACGCHISDVVQKTHLEVDESGTKASAATGIGMITSARVGGDQPFQMVVNHPFMVTIEDTASRALLFTGVIGDPTA